MSGIWKRLEDELAHWSRDGRTPAIWWRDDDAIDASPALDRLLALADRHDLPLALAVVPAAATEALASRLAGLPSGLRVLQHGYAHQNHAGPDQRKIELGPHRPAMVVAGELGTGWLALERLFGDRALAVMVPPWNRIDARLVPILPELGFVGLSALGQRQRRFPVRGLHQVNVHIDMMDWRSGPRFAGGEVLVDRIVAELAHRRASLASGRVEMEPVGLMTHHLVMDEPAWCFVAQLFDRLKSTRCASILAADVVFGEAHR